MSVVFIEQLPYIDAEYKTTNDKRRAVKGLLDVVVNLQHHCSCPGCLRDFTNDERNAIRDELPMLQQRFDELTQQSNDEYKANEKSREEARQLADQRERERRRTIHSYIESHAKIFRKLIKEFRYNGFVHLPVIPDDEKSLWNKAIELFVGNSKTYNDINEDDLQYE